MLVARGGESTGTGTGGTVPFYGDHQAGILTPQQHHLQFASYDVTASDVAELRDLLGSWTGLAARLTRGDDPVSGGGEFAPPDDTGEAGGLDPARLTLTIGFGPGLFDGRFGLAGKRPPELADLPRFEKDELDPAQSGGDICIQACSNDPQVAFHAIRNLTRDGRGGASLRWLQKGFLSPTDGGAGTPRNLMGFKDGTANLDPTNADRMDRNVWAAPGAGVGWMAGGSYLVARKIRIRIEQWDRTALGEQETVRRPRQGFGRADRGHARSTRRSRRASSTSPPTSGSRIPARAPTANASASCGAATTSTRASTASARSPPGSSSSATSRTRGASSSRSSRGSPPATCSTSTSSTPAARSSRCRRASSPAATSARACFA